MSGAVDWGLGPREGANRPNLGNSAPNWPTLWGAMKGGKGERGKGKGEAGMGKVQGEKGKWGKGGG